MSLNNSKRVHHNISRVQFRIGDAVRVIGATDETFDMQFLGKIGTVAYFEYSCGCGQSFPSDPMIGVQFGEFLTEEFWKEELGTIEKV